MFDMGDNTLLVTIADAAKLIGIGRSSCYLLIKNGDLPSVHIGGSHRVLVSEIDAFVERLRASGGIELQA